jgi:hypothetical protein
MERPPLNPELVEEDYLATTDIVKRYASTTADFSMAELHEHLTDNNVILTGTGADFKELLEEMQADIANDYAEQGHDVVWSMDREHRIARYMLGLVVRDDAGRRSVRAPLHIALRATLEPLPTIEAPEPKPPAPAAKTAKRPVMEPASQTPSFEYELLEETADRIRGALNTAPGGAMRPHWLADRLSEQGISPEITELVLEGGRAAGWLHITRIKGSRFYTLEAPDPETTPIKTRKRKATPGESAGPRPISETEVETAKEIMDLLGKAGTHVQQGQTIKTLEATLQGELSRRDLRKLLRALETLRFVTISSDANYGKARKSPKVKLRGQDMKERWNANRDGYVKRMRTITFE